MKPETTEDKLKRFSKLRARIDVLKQEIDGVHDEWQNVHEGPIEADHRQRHIELMLREMKLLEELDELLGEALLLVSANV